MDFVCFYCKLFENQWKIHIYYFDISLYFKKHIITDEIQGIYSFLRICAQLTIDFLDKDKDGCLSRDEGSKIFGDSSIVMTYRDMIQDTFSETADKMTQVKVMQGLLGRSRLPKSYQYFWYKVFNSTNYK